ncbi:hypothetical protein [Microbacterium laevaniformans]
MADAFNTWIAAAPAGLLAVLANRRDPLFDPLLETIDRYASSRIRRPARL